MIKFQMLGYHLFSIVYSLGSLQPPTHWPEEKRKMRGKCAFSAPTQFMFAVIGVSSDF